MTLHCDPRQTISSNSNPGSGGWRDPPTSVVGTTGVEPARGNPRVEREEGYERWEELIGPLDLVPGGELSKDHRGRPNVEWGYIDEWGEGEFGREVIGMSEYFAGYVKSPVPDPTGEYGNLTHWFVYRWMIEPDDGRSPPGIYLMSEEGWPPEPMEDVDDRAVDLVEEIRQVFRKAKDPSGWNLEFDPESTIKPARKAEREIERVRLWRSMIPEEMDAWREGAVIPPQKFFADRPQFAKGTDLGLRPGQFPERFGPFYAMTDVVTRAGEHDWITRGPSRLEVRRRQKWIVAAEANPKTTKGATYVHRSHVSDLSEIDQKRVNDARKHLPPGFRYTVVKVPHTEDGVSFIYSPDWDTATTPEVGASYRVHTDGTTTFTPGRGLKYHRKALFNPHVSSPERIAKSFAIASEAEAQRKKRFADYLETLLDGTSLKVGRRTWTKETFDGDSFWINEKGYLNTSGQMLKETGPGPWIKAGLIPEDWAERPHENAPLYDFNPRTYTALFNPDLSSLLTRAEPYFCTRTDRENFIKAVEKGRSCLHPFDKVRGRYKRTIATTEYKDKVIEIQERIQKWLESHTENKYAFNPLLPRFVYQLDESGSSKQIRLGRLLKRLRAPDSILRLLTRFPERRGEKVIYEISTDPVDLLTKSTGRTWAAQSCERLGAGFSRGPFHDIELNNAIVLMYKPEKPKPFGRFMIRWCNTDEGEIDIGVEPFMYPKLALNHTYRSELVALLREQGYLNYDKCKTPYKYQGWSDRAGGSKRPITYSERVRSMDEVTREIEVELNQARGAWTGVDWEVSLQVQSAAWLHPYQFITEYPTIWNLLPEDEDWDRHFIDMAVDKIPGTFYRSEVVDPITDNFTYLYHRLGYDRSDGPATQIEMEMELYKEVDEDLWDYEIEELWPNLSEEVQEQLVKEFDNWREAMEDILIEFEPITEEFWDYNVEYLRGLDIEDTDDPLQVAQTLGITEDSAEQIIEYVSEVEADAQEAEQAGVAAFQAAMAGDWDTAVMKAAEASNIENEYGDDATWGPFLRTVMEGTGVAEENPRQSRTNPVGGRWEQGRKRGRREFALNPYSDLELFRADYDPPEVGEGSYWTDSIEDAKSYLVSGPGGERDPAERKIWTVTVDTQNELDLRSDEDVLSRLVTEVYFEEAGRHLEWPDTAAGEIEGSTGRRWPYSAWEEWRFRDELLVKIKEEGYEWIIYEDDYPEGAITYMPLTNILEDSSVVEVKTNPPLTDLPATKQLKAALDKLTLIQPTGMIAIPTLIKELGWDPDRTKRFLWMLEKERLVDLHAAHRPNREDAEEAMPYSLYKDWEGASPGPYNTGRGLLYFVTWREVRQNPRAYTAREKDIANATDLPGGVYGNMKGVVAKHVYTLTRSNTGQRLLDYGAGAEARCTKALRKAGRDVTAYDYGENVTPGLHDLKALSRQYDVVMASNVLNVQASKPALKETIRQIAKATKKTGVAVVNYPARPRKTRVSDKTLEKMLRKRFRSVEKVGDHLYEARHIKQNPPKWADDWISEHYHGRHDVQWYYKPWEEAPNYYVWRDNSKDLIPGFLALLEKAERAVDALGCDLPTVEIRLKPSGKTAYSYEPGFQRQGLIELNINARTDGEMVGDLDKEIDWDPYQRILHEFGHYYYWNCLRDLYRWKSQFGQRPFVSRYAQTSPEEEFAEVFRRAVSGASIPEESSWWLTEEHKLKSGVVSGFVNPPGVPELNEEQKAAVKAAWKPFKSAVKTAWNILPGDVMTPLKANPARHAAPNPRPATYAEIKALESGPAWDRTPGPLVYWRVQDDRYPLPERSRDEWFASEEEWMPGVSFFSGLDRAVGDLAGETGQWEENISEMITQSGGYPVLVAATSKYRTIDAPGAEVILIEPKEIGRFRATGPEWVSMYRIEIEDPNWEPKVEWWKGNNQIEWEDD